jgi:MinD-like ATPase involved in chromosome partitioning or flagellar assembly
METTLGEIITFYSYKGGVGRSMALANIACLLAQKQKSDKDVLMIDWDLEAPGLHQFFHGRFINSHQNPRDLPTEQLGLIDFFFEIKDWLGKFKSKRNFPEDIFSQVDIQKYIIKLNRPSLLLMPAGRFDDGMYSARVSEFDWVDFFNNFPEVITQFAQYLRTNFRYVLIDSRTGYTDISGICTSIMPEKLVTVFTPNRQSLLGVTALIRQATDYRKQSDDLRPLMVFPLPSKIENAESELQKEWRFGNSISNIEGYQKQLETVLRDVYSLQACDLTKYFDEYQLQYIPRYSYGEELAVLSERTDDRLSLARSFENFVEKLVSGGNPWEEVEASLKDFDLATSMESNSISILGPKASGKTTYLAMLYGSALKSNVNWVVRPNDVQSTNFVRNNINLLRSGNFPQPTKPDQEPHFYNFRIHTVKPVGLSGDENQKEFLESIFDFVRGVSSQDASKKDNPEEIVVSLADVAGEEFLTISLDHPLWEHLATRDGLLCLLDPATAEDHLNVTFQLLQFLWLKLKDRPNALINGRLPHYVAFCFSKMDQPAFARFVNRPRDLVLFLETKLNLDVDKLLLQFFLPDRIKYFTISSLGLQAKVSGLEIENPKDISPINILEPLRWLSLKFDE